MARIRIAAALTIAGVLLAGAGCTVNVGGQSACPLMPPVRAEEIPKPPVSGSQLVWQPGHYDWNGGGYVWAPGAWVQQVGQGTTWQPGYWAQGPNGCAWQPPHWG